LILELELDFGIYVHQPPHPHHTAIIVELLELDKLLDEDELELEDEDGIELELEQNLVVHYQDYCMEQNMLVIN
jgi:hypothetical protein